MRTHLMQGGHLKKIGMIGYILAGVFGLVGIVDIFSVISDVAQIRSSEVVAGVDVGKEASSVTESQGLELTVLNPFHLIAAVMFLIWFHRAHRNLARAG